MEPEMSKYPLFIYKGITYFPMTSSATKGLGLSAVWNASTEELIITQIDSDTNIEEYKISTRNPSTFFVSQQNFKIKVNGKVLNNSEEEYPILTFNDVTYFPLTWKWVNDEFGWNLKFDKINGLTID